MSGSIPATLAGLLLVLASCGGGEPSGDVDPSRPTSMSTSTSTSTVDSTVPPTTNGAGPATSVQSTTTTTVRVVGEADPLRLWVIGDSFLELFGPALVNRSLDTGVIDAGVDFRYVSGLSRPDFFDWPAYAADELPDRNPDAVVVMFGGNDAQDVEVGGTRYDVGTEAWGDLYTTRVAEMMDVLLTGTDRVYWIGLPIMKSDRFTANARTMNAAYETQAGQRPGVTYFSSFELFCDESGEYNAYLDGKLMRFTDGAHFVWNGAYRLADAILPVIATDWGIELD
ncbi:MAG: DUF459 domain-containing protein [Acidimicrobiia bacterium]|nr:MAG: DUF459 domain-containing protein [Acidimicrobiia bacterium]